jgi:hypothetical protein
MAIGPKNVQFLDNENYQCTKVLQVLNCLFFLETSRFDHFQKVDYDEYVTSKLNEVVYWIILIQPHGLLWRILIDQAS